MEKIILKKIKVKFLKKKSWGRSLERGEILSFFNSW